jgi:hypothetical protein
VLKEGLLITLAGCAARIAAGHAASRLIASLLFEVAPTDVATYLAAPLLLIIGGLLGGVRPGAFRHDGRSTQLVAMRLRLQ